ncbi:MAG TPA: HAMP domain-containing sensor histidine kinase, partial [Acidobacteriota bacterium]|nr:HAMP domain-containing sensor histidine kinase [Acidobacteriota bacterium]
ERERAQDLAHQIEAARQSEQLRTTLIDAMVHEFKTPLTAIRAATTALLANPEQSPETSSEMLTIADEEAAHLAEFIDNAVEMARLDNAHIEVHLEQSDLCQVVRDVVASMRGEIEDRTVTVECCETIPRIALDPRWMKLAVKQLLDNALKYSPAGTPVKILLSLSDDAVTVGICNQGEGIPLKEQERIFERFYRSPSVRHQIPGSGLGLSIASSIVRAHEGTLTLTSSSGETTFRIALPSKKIEMDTEPEPQTIQRQPS